MSPQFFHIQFCKFTTDELLHFFAKSDSFL